MTKFFITPDGKIRKDLPKNADVPRFNLEKFSIRNTFDSRDSAHLMRDVLEERYPRIFYEERKRKQQLARENRQP